MKQQETYKTKVRNYVQKTIRIRRQLIRMGIYPNYNTILQLENLEQSLNYIKFVDDASAGRYLKKWRSVIEEIIPGKNSKCHNSLIAKLELLISEGENYSKANIKLQQ